MNPMGTPNMNKLEFISVGPKQLVLTIGLHKTEKYDGGTLMNV